MPDCSKVPELLAEIADLLASEDPTVNAPREVMKRMKEMFPSEPGIEKAATDAYARKMQLQRRITEMKGDIEGKSAKELTAKYTPKSKPQTPFDPDVARMEIEADRLRDHIRAEIEKARPKPFFKRLYNGTNNMLVDLLTSLDMGHIMRQGNFMLFSHPIRTAKAIGQMLRKGHTEAGYRMTMKEIENHPDYLHFANRLVWEDPTDAPHGLNEEIRGSIARRLPGIKWSQYTYATFVNRLRMESASAMLRSLGKNPTNADLDFMANTVNMFTGKGSLGPFKGAQGLLDAVFLATRWRVSRFQTALGVPLWQALLDKNLSPGMAKVVAAQYMRYLATQAVFRSLTIWAMLNLPDDEEAEEGIELDPRSSQFGQTFKVINGRRQYTDFMGGVGAPIRLIAQTLSHQTETTGSEDIKDLKAGDSRAQPIQRWLRQGLGPMAGLATDLLIYGNDPVGKKIFDDKYDDALSQLGLDDYDIVSNAEPKTAAEKAKRAMRYALAKNIPIISQDLVELMADEDMPNPWGVAAKEFVGMGTFTQDQGK